MIRKNLLIILYLLLSFGLHGQNSIAITIDDVPGTSGFPNGEFSSGLLKVLDKLRIPVSIFISEGKLYENRSSRENKLLLEQWIKRKYITPGNHTFSHKHFSTADIVEFQKDILKGELFSRKYAEKYRKSLRYFRFPYNDLGNDRDKREQIIRFLNRNGYTVAPFTIESSDWMFNYVYEYYLDSGDEKSAADIGSKFVEFSMNQVTFFEELVEMEFGRSIPHIFLCHDNPLIRDYLPALTSELGKRSYKFIGIEKALDDNFFKKRDYYLKKWGISWIYRYIKDPKARIDLMKTEPEPVMILDEYKKIRRIKKGG